MKNNSTLAAFASDPAEMPDPAKSPTRLRSFFRAWGGTMLWWAFVLSCCLQYHAGFMMFMFAIPWLIVIIFYLLAVALKPERRKIGFIRLVVGLICLLAIWTTHKYYAYDSRARGEAAVASVLAFKNKFGHYPAKPEEIGLRSGGPGTFNFPHYLFDAGKPVLFYYDTFTLYRSYKYDFDAGTWRHLGG